MAGAKRVLMFPMLKPVRVHVLSTELSGVVRNCRQRERFTELYTGGLTARATLDDGSCRPSGELLDV